MIVNRYREETAVNNVIRSLTDKLFPLLPDEIKEALHDVYEMGYKDAYVDEVKYIVENAIREILREMQKPSDENNKEESES